MDKNWMDLLQKQSGLKPVMKANQRTEQFGLTLTRQDAELILRERKGSGRTEKSGVRGGDNPADYL